LQAQGFKLPPKQRHQKATLAELLTLAIFLLLQGQDLAKGYLAAKTTLKAYFPSLPHLSRFYRVLQKAPELLAHLAVRLSGGKAFCRWWTSNPSPWPTATGSTASFFAGPFSLEMPRRPGGGTWWRTFLQSWRTGVFAGSKGLKTRPGSGSPGKPHSQGSFAMAGVEL